jgi:hypothetical protein
VGKNRFRVLAVTERDMLQRLMQRQGVGQMLSVRMLTVLAAGTGLEGDVMHGLAGYC